MGECEKSVCNVGMNKWCMVHCWIRTVSILALAVAAVLFVAGRPEPRDAGRDGSRMRPMKAPADMQPPAAKP